MKKTIRIIGIILVLFAVMSSFMVFFGDRSRSNNHKNSAIDTINGFVAKPFEDVTYVAFGDSITYGIDGVNGGRMANPYPTLVGTALGFRHPLGDLGPCPPWIRGATVVLFLLGTVAFLWPEILQTSVDCFLPDIRLDFTFFQFKKKI